MNQTHSPTLSRVHQYYLLSILGIVLFAIIVAIVVLTVHAFEEVDRTHRRSSTAPLELDDLARGALTVYKSELDSQEIRAKALLDHQKRRLELFTETLTETQSFLHAKNVQNYEKAIKILALLPKPHSP